MREVCDFKELFFNESLPERVLLREKCQKLVKDGLRFALPPRCKLECMVNV